jgi:protein gp37
MYEQLGAPLRWRKTKRVFVPSMGDLFCDSVPFRFIAAVFGIMAVAHQHDFQVLTKHPKRMLEFFEWTGDEWSVGNVLEKTRGYMVNFGVSPDLLDRESSKQRSWPLSNVWLGTSVEGQNQLVRVDYLRKCPAVVRFLSCEPLLERVDITSELATGELHWVIAGGESGPKARPCAMEWIQELVEQCAEASIPCFVKQLGAVVVSEERAAETLEEAQELCGPKKKDRWLWSAGFKSPAGADPDEWPDRCQVQEFPVVNEGHV